MKILTNSILFLAMVTAGLACKPQNNLQKENQETFEKMHPNFSAQFEEQVKTIFQEKELQGDFIFAVVDENGLAYSYALNKAILEGEASTLTNSSPIYIASHTKSFTGTLLKILEENGRLDLNKSLAAYLPALDFRDSIDANMINIKELLSHTHGTFSTILTWKTAFLGYQGGNEALINDFNNDFLHDPSHRFRYSNVGSIVAGMIVDEVMKNSWKDEMKTHIFDPLGMKHTSAYVSDYNFSTIRPSVISSKENGVVDIGFYKADNTMHAAGGIISTIDDLSIWLSANIREDEALMSKEAWVNLHTAVAEQNRTYFTYNRTGYSLGWDIAEYQNEKILTRFGGLAGISFHISFMPEKKLGIIALTTDNRAFVLPHLMANLAYNKLNSLGTDTTFISEKARFDKSFNRENELSYPDQKNLLEVNKGNNSIVGHYETDEGWPSISIDIIDNQYQFRWGLLDGEIYKTTEKQFTSHLGPLSRDFEILNDSLFTGSLIYKKNNL
ncbi:MAG: CubicO group peptidase (beta-lactamase class C family) [Marivirga sp.]|jgi:CubicO group peptidase (beta-lactamase class C family)